MSVLTMPITDAGPAARIGSGGMNPLSANVKTEGVQQAEVHIAARDVIGQESECAVVVVQGEAKGSSVDWVRCQRPVDR